MSLTGEQRRFLLDILQNAKLSGAVGNDPALDELIDVVQRDAERHDRYKAAAEALWQLLDDIDTADDQARDDDARYRVTARTIAKRRSEHAVSFNGQTLVWSWDRPLPAEDFAKLEVKVLQAEATEAERAEYKRLRALHEPPLGDDGPTIERCRHCGCEWRCPECDGLPVVRGEHADTVVLDELDPAVDWGGGSDEGDDGKS